MSSSGKSARTMLLSRDEAETLWYYKIGFAIFYFLQATAVIILSLVKFSGSEDGSCTWLSTTLNVTSDYRTGPTIDPVDAAGGTQYWGSAQVGAVGPVNIGLLIGIASASEFLWLLVNLFFHDREMLSVANDYNPFRWWRYAWSHGMLWLAISIIAGVSNVFVLTLLVLAVIGWIIFFSDNENFNSVSVNRARFKRAESMGESVNSWYFYDSYVRAIAFFLVTATIIFIHLGYSAGNDIFEPETVSLATVSFVTPIVGAVVYLALPVIIYLHHSQVTLETVSDKERAMYWWQIIFITSVTWLSLALFTAVDCIIPPE